MKNREKLLQKQSSVTLAAVFCCLLWGSAFPGIKAGYVLGNARALADETVGGIFGLESAQENKNVLPYD